MFYMFPTSKKITTVAAVGFTCVILGSVTTGCSSSNGPTSISPNTLLDVPDVDYSKARAIKSLEVPDDLSKPDFDDTFFLANESTQKDSRSVRPKDHVPAVSPNIKIVAESEDIPLEGSGGHSILPLPLDAEAAWPKLLTMLEAANIEAADMDQATGIINTVWQSDMRRPVLRLGGRTLLDAARHAMYPKGTQHRFRLIAQGSGSSVEVRDGNGGLLPKDDAAIVLDEIKKHYQ